MLSNFGWAAPRAVSSSAASPVSARARAAIACALLAAAAGLSAHEGHGGPQRPVYRQAQSGNGTYRIGFAMLPQDALVGEDVRFEVQLLQMADPAAGPGPGRPLGSGDVQVRIISTSAEPYTLPHVGPGEKPGTYTARYRFADSGQYAIAASAKAGAETITAEFPVLVAAGPVFRTTILLDLIVILIVGALIVSQRRCARGGRRGKPGAFTRCGGGSRGDRGPGGRPPVAWSASGPDVSSGTSLRGRGVGSGSAARPGGSCAPPRHVDPPETPPHTHPPGTKPHSHPPKGKASRRSDPWRSRRSSGHREHRRACARTVGRCDGPSERTGAVRRLHTTRWTPCATWSNPRHARVQLCPARRRSPRQSAVAVPRADARYEASESRGRPHGGQDALSGPERGAVRQAGHADHAGSPVS